MADRSQTGNSGDRVVYRPSAEDLAEAVAILVDCGAVRSLQYWLSPKLSPKFRATVRDQKNVQGKSGTIP